jgi:hypothetical protein
MDSTQPKFFNIAGNCVPKEHYMLPVLPHISDIDDIVERKYYFILHAPRQSGKTTFIQALTSKINADGKYYALNSSLATLRNVFDVETAINSIAALINISVKRSMFQALKSLAYPDDSIPKAESAVKINIFLNYLCISLDKDLVVFFDEADCLTGPVVETFLAQIRDGYLDRHTSKETKFPRSMALVGMRDISDYLVKVRPEEQSTGSGSPFNIIEKSLTLANFTRDEGQILYNQHTEATGQKFTDESVNRAWYWSGGQPWLVNALAKEVVENQFKNNYAAIITDSNIDQAADTLIHRRDAHIKSLLERLKQPRIIRVMEPIIVGDDFWPKDVTDDDIRYAVDLGLIIYDGEIAWPANPIYGEMIIRTLAKNFGVNAPKKLANRWMGGQKLDMTGLLKNFQQYWLENFELIDSPKSYTEAMPHLVLFTFLQRVLNGGVDSLTRDYALGRRRLDIGVKYKSIS